MKILITVLGIFCVTAVGFADLARSDDDTDAASGGAVVEKKVEAKSKKKKAKAAKGEDKKDVKKAEAKPKKESREDGLVIDDLKVGDGMEAKVGSRVKVHYTGTFMNGKVFDSNATAKPEEIEPFTLDKDHLIAGWVEGIPGMKVGGKRKLKVPYKLAYGENGTPDGSIPPKADLNFEVELLKVE